MHDRAGSERGREGPRLVFLARHGATRANDEGVRIGLSPEPLSARGVAQARELAAEVRCMPIRVIWTSPLVRARQTAEIVARLVELPVRASHDLREMDYGPLEGLTETEIAERYPEERHAWWSDAPMAALGVEPIASVRARVLRAIERIAASDVALLITHLTPMRVALAQYGGCPPALAPRFLPDPCALYRLSSRGLERACGKVMPEERAR